MHWLNKWSWARWHTVRQRQQKVVPLSEFLWYGDDYFVIWGRNTNNFDFLIFTNLSNFWEGFPGWKMPVIFTVLIGPSKVRNEVMRVYLIVCFSHYYNTLAWEKVLGVYFIGFLGTFFWRGKPVRLIISDLCRAAEYPFEDKEHFFNRS